ncbi:Protein of unknown function [Pyronema omphalodes CBS 100304]|uniref:Uncharacterized protein n=1 Tax=Pyronema omphalodes (strain CBS 100304) TaxID=1076935 RepID=U4LVL6_PYROM|nr:Protein of unknown function [Pyronema omphalodes CBS 100304]
MVPALLIQQFDIELSPPTPQRPGLYSNT